LLARSLIAPDSLALYRAIVAEAERLPVLGAVFYQHGPQLARSMAARILAKRFDEKTAAAKASTFVALVLWRRASGNDPGLRGAGFQSSIQKAD
jgi:TetR/AcrR family transcriptional repressor of mexJK operon